MKAHNRVLTLLLISPTLLIWLPLAKAAHAGDASHGAKLFEQECAECHSVKPGKNKKGPTLFAIAGRTAGSVADFVYSDAMKSSGVIWTADKLDTYIAAPRKLVPGCKMKYDGLADASARTDIVEFLNHTH